MTTSINTVNPNLATPDMDISHLPVWQAATSPAAKSIAPRIHPPKMHSSRSQPILQQVESQNKQGRRSARSPPGRDAHRASSIALQYPSRTNENATLDSGHRRP